MKAKDIRENGSVLWFEYHCWESTESQDYELWLRSHQKVTIIKMDDCEEPFGTMIDRGEAGQPVCYVVRFEDGVEFTATEDELLDSKDQFERPDPPNYSYQPAS